MTDTYATLSTLLASDPANHALLVDTAEAALDAREPEAAETLLARAADVAPAGPREINLAAVAALQRRDYGVAAERLTTLMDAGEDAPGLRYNLAWARANAGDKTGALAVLDDATALTLAQGATLRIGLLHEAGELDEAGEAARRYAEAWPDDEALMATISVLAIDLEDVALAAAAAQKGGERPEALSTLGTLALGQDRATEAEALFDRALARDARQPRALVGRGLARLLTGGSDAAADIDRGAELFGDHLGSWIAAGWAHFTAGDRTAANARFARALALDDSFAESHGSLAVIAALEGDLATAERESEVALRLDRHCYSAALARTLLAAGEGDAATAQAIFARAIETPVDGTGRTIAQALATMGLVPRG